MKHCLSFWIYYLKYALLWTELKRQHAGFEIGQVNVATDVLGGYSIVFVKLKVKKPKTTPQYITTRSYKKYNADLFVTDLAKKADSLLTIFDQTDVDSKLNILNDTLQSVLSLHVPVKQIKRQSP